MEVRASEKETLREVEEEERGGKYWKINTKALTYGIVICVHR